jgi:hypothetical protein
MKEYVVEACAIYSRLITVEAESEDDAEDKAAAILIEESGAEMEKENWDIEVEVVDGEDGFDDDEDDEDDDFFEEDDEFDDDDFEDDDDDDDPFIEDGEDDEE